MLLKVLSILFFTLFFSVTAYAHSGSHGNNECTITLGGIELRLNGYQFQGSQPDRHYCRHFPYLGQTILKIDSVTADLNDMAVELLLLKRNSWLGLVLQAEDAFSVVKQLPLQYFSKQVVSIDSDVQSRDIYAIKLRLHKPGGEIVEQRFMFLIGFPFAQIMVAISVLLLLFIAFIVLKSLWFKRQE